jgi:hypothetical protein
MNTNDCIYVLRDTRVKLKYTLYIEIIDSSRGEIYRLEGFLWNFILSIKLNLKSMRIIYIPDKTRNSHRDKTRNFKFDMKFLNMSVLYA